MYAHKLEQLRPARDSSLLAGMLVLHLTALQLILMGSFFFVVLLPASFVTKSTFLASVPTGLLVFMLGFFPASMNLLATGGSILLYRKDRPRLAYAVTIASLLWTFGSFFVWLWLMQ
jgi:hypothetical protein